MKKRPKLLTRFLRTIILLLILTALGAVFYFGYYQFQLPADNYGVIFTKLDGWKDEVIMPGGFRFEWQGLIPLNLQIEKFEIIPHTASLSAAGELPSADSYSLYLKDSPDFKYSYSFDVTYTLKPEMLPTLVSDDFLRSNNIEEWIKDIETQLVSDASGLIRLLADNTEYMKKIGYNYRLMEDDLQESLSKEYIYLDFVRFTPVDINFPDLALYEEGRKQYFEMEDFHNDIESAALEQTETRLVEESAKLELLEKYGAIFSKYPQLIDYYKIYQKDGRDLIPSIDLPETDSEKLLR